ncbi:uncharacterized protein LOC135128353 [Zophobas morio]|uniref:uncharacterized protein LOC135128353 n=1 Tax=Zophobas morio TaxID=2755281 RepID=UPI003082A238
MGLCISTVITADHAPQREPLNQPESPTQPLTVQEVVRKQPKRTKNFDADDNPLPTAGCCVCCMDPNLCNLCCGCDCGDCVLCYWCLTCDCCLECDDCCGQCLSNCI